MLESYFSAFEFLSHGMTKKNFERLQTSTHNGLQSGNLVLAKENRK
jgi:hypothetical protein